MRKVITIVLTIVLTSCLKANAAEEPQLLMMRCTAYCIHGTTASGTPTRIGICATGRKELLGKTVILYRRLPGNEIGDYIGIYEVMDTGCNSNVIDIWQPTLDDCQKVMDCVYEQNAAGRIFVQVIEGAEG